MRFLTCLIPLIVFFGPLTAIILMRRFSARWRRAGVTPLAVVVWLIAFIPVCQIVIAAAFTVIVEASQRTGMVDLTGVPYADLIAAAAAQHGVDSALVAAVVANESNFDPQAVSPVGAIGLMQIMPGTAAELGLLEPFDAAANLDAGTAYLATMLNRYDGDLSLALAAYNAGPARVDTCWCIPNNGETPQYVVNVLAAATRYRQPDNRPILPYASDVTPRLTDANPDVLPFEGQDWATPCGTPLYAPITGIVTAVGFDGYKGQFGSNNSYIIFDDGAGTEVILLHGRYTAQIGQPVQRGTTQIGYEASIGNSTGCHTDYSIRQR